MLLDLQYLISSFFISLCTELSVMCQYPKVYSLYVKPHSAITWFWVCPFLSCYYSHSPQIYAAAIMGPDPEVGNHLTNRLIVSAPHLSISIMEQVGDQRLDSRTFLSLSLSFTHTHTQHWSMQRGNPQLCGCRTGSVTQHLATLLWNYSVGRWQEVGW